MKQQMATKIESKIILATFIRGQVKTKLFILQYLLMYESNFQFKNNILYRVRKKSNLNQIKAYYPPKFLWKQRKFKFVIVLKK